VSDAQIALDPYRAYAAASARLVAPRHIRAITEYLQRIPNS